MWAPDDFPGAENVPWQLLIRARYVYEIDAILATMAVRHLSAYASEHTVAEFATAATEAIRGASREEVTAEHRLRVLGVAADWEDGEICPRPFRFPHPHPHFDDPYALVALDRIGDLFERAGSALAAPVVSLQVTKAAEVA